MVTAYRQSLKKAIFKDEVALKPLQTGSKGLQEKWAKLFGRK